METAWKDADTHLSFKRPLVNARGLQLCTTSPEVRTQHLYSEWNQSSYLDQCTGMTQKPMMFGQQSLYKLTQDSLTLDLMILCLLKVSQRKQFGLSVKLKS